MTTAHRPTWKAAVGRENEGGWSAGGAISTQRSALDAPAHTKLKFRDDVAAGDKNNKEILRKSLLALEQAEQTASLKKNALPHRPVDPAVEERSKQRLLKQTAEVDDVKLKEKYNDSDVEEQQSSEEEESDLDNDDDDSDLDSSRSSDDDEDDEAALHAELAKIRAEREEAKRKADERLAAEETAKQEEAALLGNPLLSNQDGSGGVASGKMKRRWNDDVVFRNQAKGQPAPKKRFINDTVRNDFHKRFLNKFIR